MSVDSFFRTVSWTRLFGFEFGTYHQESIEPAASKEKYYEANKRVNKICTTND